MIVRQDLKKTRIILKIKYYAMRSFVVISTSSIAPAPSGFPEIK